MAPSIKKSSLDAHIGPPKMSAEISVGPNSQQKVNILSLSRLQMEGTKILNVFKLYKIRARKKQRIIINL